MQGRSQGLRKTMSSHTGTFDTIFHASLGLAAGLSAAFFAVLAIRLGASAWLLALLDGVSDISQ